MRKIVLAIGVLFAISVCSIASTPDDYNNTVFSEEVSTNPDSLIDLKVYLKNYDYDVKSVQFTIVLPDSVDFVVNGSDYSFNRSYLLTDDWTVSVRTKKGDKPNTAIVLIYNISDINSIIPVGVNELMTLKLKVNHDVASGTKLVEVNQITLTDGDGNEHTDMRMKVSSSIVITMPQFSIKYYLDGTIYDTYTVPYGSIIELLELSDREGYSFSGWQDAPLTMPDHDIAISGFFIPNNYRLSWIVDSVTILTDSVKYGDVLTIIDSPTKEGYSFSGWSEIPSVMPASDVEITGSFSVNSYNLVYTLDGEPYKTLVLNYGSSIIAEPNPIREGYTFSGWSGEPSTMPAGDVEITGFFNINTYNLVYKVDGATYKSLSVVYGNEIIPEVTPVKEGYTFSGWSEIPSTMPACNVEITGSFSVNSYNLVYKIGDETYKTTTVEYGSSIIAEPNPDKEGYTFSGWGEIPSTMPANDVEVTGYYRINAYNLIYVIEGEVYKTITVEYGSSITPEPFPSKDGYTFSGWSEIPSVMPASDVEITGSFSVNSYNLVYTLDGEPYKTLVLNYGSSIIAEPNPIREGYTFSGWSGEPSTMPAGDVEITGFFNINTYNLVYKVDGATYKSLSVIYGNEIIPEVTPVKEGYTFSGWSEIPSTMPAGDVEISGTFSVNSYNLVYIVDGETYKSMTVEYGSSIIAEPEPTKEGSTFSGWSGVPSTMPARDVEITGSFDSNSYKLIYKLDGEIYKSSIVKYGSEITAEPAPVREGYTFSGWSEIPSTMPSSDVEITGTFSVNSYNLVYKVDGETYKTLSLDYGSSITAEQVPVKEGYTFSGWSMIPSTMPANDVEITGTFSINSYRLVYKVDGATYKSMSVVYGSEITAEIAPTKEGYTFSGWNDIPATMPASDVEVTGMFSINSYNLVYKIGDETYKTTIVEYGSSIIAEPNPEKEGYTFSGWSEIPSVMPAGDLVVSGLFSVNYHELRYKIDGEIYKTDSVAYGSTIIAENAPAIVGYIFSGWDGIPVTMPDYDVEVTGSFVVNSYLLTVIVDGEVFYSDSVAYGTTLADYVEMLTDKGIDLSQWEYYGEIDTMVMPAHDVVINALLDAVRPIQTDANRLVVYDLNGKKLEVDDISALPTGIYIINGRKYVLQ